MREEQGRVTMDSGYHAMGEEGQRLKVSDGIQKTLLVRGGKTGSAVSSVQKSAIMWSNHAAGPDGELGEQKWF